MSIRTRVAFVAVALALLAAACGGAGGGGGAATAKKVTAKSLPAVPARRVRRRPRAR